MPKVDIDTIEYQFNIKVKRNTESLGIDTASKTGYCSAKSNTKTVNFNFGFFNVDVLKIKNKTKREELRYRAVFENLNKIIKAPDVVVAEGAFYQRNPKTTIILASIGGMAMGVAMMKNIPRVYRRTAVEARKALGLKGNSSKEDILSTVNMLLDIDISNDDEADAVILALNGLIE